MKIPKRPYQRWDGELKYYTKDCNNCEWYRKINNEELCGWGISFKYLIRIEKPRMCEVKNRKQSQPISARYLDEVIKEGLTKIKNAMD